MSWRRTHDHHSCSFPPQSSATTTNHTHSNVRSTTVHQTDCGAITVIPAHPNSHLKKFDRSKVTKITPKLLSVCTPWPTRFAVPRASNENISLRRYYATSLHSGNNVNKFPDWSAARALHMQSSWLDARMIDSSGRQKAYKKRQHMSFGATLQYHGTQKIINAIAHRDKAERNRIDSDRQRRKTSPFSRSRQPFFKNGKIWHANQTGNRRQPPKTNNTSQRTRRCSNDQTPETTTDVEGCRRANGTTSPREPGRLRKTADGGLQASPEYQRPATPTDQPNKNTVDASIDVCGTPGGTPRNYVVRPQRHPRPAQSAWRQQQHRKWRHRQRRRHLESRHPWRGKPLLRGSGIVPVSTQQRPMIIRSFFQRNVFWGPFFEIFGRLFLTFMCCFAVPWFWRVATSFRHFFNTFLSIFGFFTIFDFSLNEFEKETCVWWLGGKLGGSKHTGGKRKWNWTEVNIWAGNRNKIGRR